MSDGPHAVQLPRVARVMAGVVLVAALGLGVWQLRRDGERNAGREAALLVEGLPPVGDAEPVGAALLWREVRWRGRYEGTPELIGGRMQGDELGYGVAQRFIRADGLAVLVDRGWTPATAAEATVVALSLGSDTTLAGQLRPALGSASAVALAGHGARIWPAKAWPAILRTLEGATIGEFYVVAGPTDESFVTDKTLPKGSVIGVPLRDDTSLHYAAQWFAISAIMGIVMVPAALQRARHFLGA